jgi:hypothetical protein
MSGFFGMVRTDGEAVQQEFLDGVARGLEFRGPDGTNTWKKDGVGFCFTRLDTRRELVAELSGKGQPAREETTDEELLRNAGTFGAKRRCRGSLAIFPSACGMRKGNRSAASGILRVRVLFITRKGRMLYIFPTRSRFCEEFPASPASWMIISFAIFCWRDKAATPSAPRGAVCGDCGPVTG